MRELAHPGERRCAASEPGTISSRPRTRQQTAIAYRRGARARRRSARRRAGALASHWTKLHRRLQGIAVGIATKIPPHNLVEVVAAMRALVQDPGLSDEQLHEFVLGPDFPTGGVLLATSGVKATYTEGRGSVTVRSRVQIEAGQGRSDRDVIAVTELPYQVCRNGTTLYVSLWRCSRHSA